MTSAQKLIVWDYLRRWRWLLILGAMMHLFWMIAAGWTGDGLFMGVIFISAVLLHFENKRGGGKVRTLLSLPLTAAELGRCWRLLGFTFPAVGAFGILVLATFVRWIFRAPIVSGEGFLIAAISQTVLLGGIYGSFVGITPGPTGEQYTISFGSGVLKQGAALLLVIFCYYLILSVVQPFPGNWEKIGPTRMIALAFLAGITGFAWRDSEAAPLRRLARPGAPQPRRKSPKSVSQTSWSGYGGMPFLLLRHARQLAPLWACMIVFAWIFPKVLGFRTDNQFMVAMFIFFTIYLGSVSLLNQLRELRTLPLSRSGFCHLLVLWPFLLSLCFLEIPGLAVVAWFDSSGQWLPWELAFATAVAATPMLPLLLRFGYKGWIALTFIPIMMGIASLGLSSDFHSDWQLVLGAGALVLALVWTLTYRLLGSSHPWRSAAFRSPGQTRRIG